MLGRLLRGRTRAVAPEPSTAAGTTVAIDADRPAVLNVGGNSKKIGLPDHYAGWHHVLLDIDPGRDADLVCDARELSRLAPGRFDAVYCSHNLEHYFRHDVPRVLAGFLHVLKVEGFAEVRVPDLPAVFRKAIDDGMDVEDVLYESPAGPMRVLDVIYGWGREIEESGHDFFAHKTGFSRRSLVGTLVAAGFAEVWCAPPIALYEVRAIGFRRPSTPAQRSLLGIPLELPGGGG